MVNKYQKKAVFLDRDGVIIESKLKFGKPVAIIDKKDIKILQGVASSIYKLINAGFELIVVTNQPDIAKGITTFEIVNQIHLEISRLTGLKHFYICPHVDSDFCKCRKPQPGLLTTAAQELSIDLTRSFLIGDRWRDISSGQSVGCVNFFIDYGYDEAQPSPPYIRVGSLFEAASLICSSKKFV